MRPAASSLSFPLAFHPDNTALHHLPKTTGFDDLRQIAAARLMLDNIPHIKAYWMMMTPSVAQIAQRFGANDIDGTVVEEKIYHDAGATTSQGLRRQDLLRLIREAGREPSSATPPIVRSSVRNPPSPSSCNCRRCACFHLRYPTGFRANQHAYITSFDNSWSRGNIHGYRPDCFRAKGGESRPGVH